MKAYYHRWNSPIGTLHFIADDTALLALAYDGNVEAIRSRLEIREQREGENPIIAQAKAELVEYFERNRDSFTVPIRLVGTEFQKKVWQVLRKIPFGGKKSYLEQARELGSELAVRAVGTANGQNPISILVPCHRVVRKDGSLGGYAGGLPAKEKLLELESRK